MQSLKSRCSKKEGLASKSPSVDEINSNKDNEEDYMSDTFLNNLNDVKPGLVVCRSIQRERNVEVNRRKNRCPTMAEKESQRLNEGLQKRVGPDNKGFNLLAKMGYKPGEGLGKNADGRSEPVGIEIPKGREGLGFATAKQECSKYIENLRQQQQMALRSQFRETMAERFRYNQIRRQLKSAQRICRDLDLSDSIDSPFDSLFWPPENKSDENSDEEATKDKTWDGKKRKIEVSVILEEENVNEDFLESDLAKLDANNADCDSSIEKLLSQILGYLRGQHNYCFWCSVHYESYSDLLSYCPGENQDDHD